MSPYQTPQCFSVGQTPQKCPFPWEHLHPIYNTWFLGPTRVNILNGITIGSAAIAGLTVETDKPRYACSNAIGRI